jgi:hypothetical protein
MNVLGSALTAHPPAADTTGRIRHYSTCPLPREPFCSDSHVHVSGSILAWIFDHNGSPRITHPCSISAKGVFCRRATLFSKHRDPHSSYAQAHRGASRFRAARGFTLVAAGPPEMGRSDGGSSRRPLRGRPAEHPSVRSRDNDRHEPLSFCRWAAPRTAPGRAVPARASRHLLHPRPAVVARSWRRPR